MADVRRMVFFGDDGQPLHLLARHQTLPGKVLAYCGEAMPGWFRPKPKHLCRVEAIVMTCPGCEATRKQLATEPAQGRMFEDKPNL